MSETIIETEVNEPPCECYKKLHLLGLPLYINQENDYYSEHEEFEYERAFQLLGPLEIEDKKTDYPIVEENDLSFVFQVMTEVIPSLADFEVNVLSFWIMDVFIEGLLTAQKAHMPHDHQKATLQWIAYMFNYIEKNNPTRRDLFIHLKTILFMCHIEDSEFPGESLYSDRDDYERSISNKKKKHRDWELPLPPGIKQRGSGQQYEESEDDIISQDTNFTRASEEESTDYTSTSDLTKPETISQRNLRHTKIILQILYRIFARLWVFTEIQTAFHGMPTLEQIDLPFKLNFPKPTFKPEVFVPPKIEKGGKKSAVPHKTPEELEAEKEAHKHDYILPLKESEEAKAYIKQYLGSISDRSVPGRGKKERKDKM